jgi:hypothetical protein
MILKVLLRQRCKEVGNWQFTFLDFYVKKRSSKSLILTISLQYSKNLFPFQISALHFQIYQFSNFQIQSKALTSFFNFVNRYNMSLEVTGRLHAKFPTQQIKDNFSKREFVLELTDESPTGMVFTNYASFQLVNQACAVVDQFQEGDVLKVTFNIRGNRWERDGQVKYITNLNAWRVEKANVAAAPGAPQPQKH